MSINVWFKKREGQIVKVETPKALRFTELNFPALQPRVVIERLLMNQGKVTATRPTVTLPESPVPIASPRAINAPRESVVSIIAKL